MKSSINNPNLGGRTKTSGANAIASGPVYALRSQLHHADGTVWTQQQFADAVPTSRMTISRAEIRGRWPSLPIKTLLLQFAQSRGLKIPASIP